MIEPKKVTLGEYTFIIKPFGGFDAVKLDRKVLRILAPALKGLDGVKDLDSEINLGALGDGIAEALDSIADYDGFIREMFKEVLVEFNGAPMPLVPLMDTVFQGNVLSFYKLIIEVMKHNRFSFFEVAGGGGGIQKIFSSFGLKESGNSEVKSSEKSGS